MSQTAALAEQLRQAQQQLAKLQARLDALEAREAAPVMAQAAAPALPAPALPTPSVPPAEAKAEQALALAEKTQSMLATTNKAVSAVRWAADTTLSGRLYLNFSNINQHTAGGANANSGIGVNLKRAYITLDHRFSKIWAASITLDAENAFGQTGSTNPSAANAAQIIGKGAYVKKAFAEARFDPAFTLRVGSVDMPWITYTENLNGLRHIERAPVDRVGYGTSPDWGVHVMGDLYHSDDDGVSYAVSVVNGAGYRQVRVTKAVDVEGRLSGVYHGIYAAIGGYVGKRGNDAQALGSTPSTWHTARRLDAAAGYRGAFGGLGVEYFYAKDWNNVASNPALYALSEDSASGWSVAGDYSLSRQWKAFARYDLVKPNQWTVPRLRDDYLNIGLQYSPVRLLDIALVYKHEVVNGGAVNGGNAVVGCSTTATANSFVSAASAAATCAGNGAYNEIGVFSQLRF